MSGKSKFLWLAVTPDKYEFPIFIEETSYKLGEKLGIRNSTVVHLANQNCSGKLSGRKIVKVKLEED